MPSHIMRRLSASTILLGLATPAFAQTNAADDGATSDTIVVTGHTDRLGAAAYNLSLSQRRAQAVKDYLVESGNIPAGKITTRGVNGSNPVTTMAQCGDGLARAALITCLAPDRRVEVEVTGTQAR